MSSMTPAEWIVCTIIFWAIMVGLYVIIGAFITEM